MTEIRQYRGKIVDNGEWVYGYYLFFNDADDDFKHIVIPSENADMFTSDYFKSSLGFDNWHKVIPETVGQWIGEYDKDKKPIYEDDVCLVSLKFFDIKNEKAKVVFKDGGFQFQYGCNIDYTKWYSAWETNSIERIGNIHDSPDLLNSK